MIYSVAMNGQDIGTVSMVRKGLYVEIECACSYPQREFQRLYMVFDDKKLDLGILIPKGEEYVIRKKIPVKYLGNGSVSFRIEPAAGCKNELVELFPDKPFPYVHRVTEGIFARKGNRRYIYFQSSDKGNSASS
jgi:hypothetical protein